MKRKFFRYASIVLGLLALAAAEGTHTWEQRKFDDFEKGTAKGVAIRSDGGLELAPSFKSLITTPSTYIWSVAADAQGNAYAAAGSPGRVYRITPQGQATIIFQPQELQVQALLVDNKGVVYAATSPDGKVYKIEHKSTASSNNGRKDVTPSKAAAPAAPANPEDKTNVEIDPNYTSSVWFDPKSKYIWALAEDSQGRIYVATGDHGEIFRVNPDGTNSVFFKSDEAHIRSLAIDTKGNAIAGSDGSGLVYRISPAGEAFVLYSAPKKEITSLTIDAQGNIYAAGVGEKTPRMVGGLNAGTFSLPASTPTISIGGGPTLAQITQGANIPIIPFPATGATGGSEIYKISPDGSPQRLWSSKEDVVYSLALDAQNRLLAATGNHGKIFVITGPGQFTDLVQASANQVTALAKSPSGGVYAATSNLGKIFLLGGTPEAQGEFESDVFDAKIFSRWGRVEVRGQGAFDLFARSGNVDNPDRNWSPWSKVDFAKGSELDVPAARFVQWKAVLKPGNPAPVIDSVLVNYLPTNVAPEITDVTVQPGARFNPIPKPPVENVTVAAANTPAMPKFEAPVPAVKDKNSIALRWTANDENDDDLVYTIYYRGDNETQWKLLKGDLDDSYYSFDASLLPDGGYVFKVVASDAPSHSPQDALSSSRTSDRVEVDTTPPQVQNLNAAVDNDSLHITFRAVDGFSVIKRAEYSIDAGPWQYVEPVGGLSDYRVENYDFSAPMPHPAPVAGTPANTSGEHVVVVRAYDRFENMGSAKFVVH
ncbi:MAG: two-component regulator propeller domain-containing protein [Terriglobales bacterium]